MNKYILVKRLMSLVCLCLLVCFFASCAKSITEEELKAHVSSRFGEDVAAAVRAYGIEPEAMDELSVYAPLSFYVMGQRGEPVAVHFPIADRKGNIRLICFVNKSDGLVSSATPLFAPLMDALVKQGVDRAVFVRSEDESTLYAVSGDTVLKCGYTNTAEECDAAEAETILNFIEQRELTESLLSVDATYTELARDSCAKQQ